jgi:hypothetical protein
MAAMGLLVSAFAPALVVFGRRWLDWDRLAVPALAALPGFAVLHAVITLGAEAFPPPMPLRQAPALVLLLGAVLFWLPILGRRRRLPDPGRSAYLFIAAPVLDLPAVWLVAQGQVTEGLAMIVGMLPLGVAAIGITWRWITMEERAQQ